MSKRVLFSFCLSLVSLLICVVLLEITVRVLDIVPPPVTKYRTYVTDEYLPFKPMPLSTFSGRSITDEFDYTYTHNSFGLRDSEHAHNKDTNVFRILGLGDSFTYGGIYAQLYESRGEE